MTKLSRIGCAALALCMVRPAYSAEKRDEHGLTEIHYAAQKDVTLLKQLLSEGRDPNARGSGRWTPLFSAVVVSNSEAVSALLEAGADVNAESDDGNRPLHHANDVISPILLAHGARADSKNKQGWTPLHSAAFFGRIETVRLLLAAGALATAKNADGKSPLQLAREKKQTAVVAVLESLKE